MHPGHVPASEVSFSPITFACNLAASSALENEVALNSTCFFAARSDQYTRCASGFQYRGSCSMVKTYIIKIILPLLGLNCWFMRCYSLLFT